MQKNSAAQPGKAGKPGKPVRNNAPLKELTIRGVVIGGLITLIFTAANVYLGLKVGLTFATSIPAAVISMALLRKFADHTTQENNIVQTIASAAGTLSSIIFVLPGLIMIGYWTGFNYWETALVCLLGGTLGVMYSVPLRNVLVTGSDLPYPEGVAAAEVLKVGDAHGADEENKKGLKVIVVGGLLSAGMQFLASLKVIAGSFAKYIKVGTGGTMIASNFSLALIGVGHLVGLTVGMSMLIGLFVSWGVLVPIFSQGLVLPDASNITAVVSDVHANKVRFVGAGAMAVAAVWTLIKIIGPIVKGIKNSFASAKRRSAGEEVPRTEQDLSIKTVCIVSAACIIPIGVLLWLFLKDTPIVHHTVALIAISVLFILLCGLIIASICGYMAGLIGASNSPISGIAVITVLCTVVLVKVVAGADVADHGDALIAYTLFTAAIVMGIATISNDNLQDLKTGQLVGATPWKQQVALVIGVVFGSLVIPPVLELMNTAFGFAGAPNAGPNALAAPQAMLLSSIAKGVISGDLRWDLFGLGAIMGFAVCVINEILIITTKNRKRKLSLPPLAVAMGMYLPLSTNFLIAVGSVIGCFYDKWADKQSNPKARKRMGILLATGLIVGESLYGVFNAGIIAASGSDAPLAIMPAWFSGIDQITGAIVFVAVVFFVYRWIKGLMNDVGEKK